MAVDVGGSVVKVGSSKVGLGSTSVSVGTEVAGASVDVSGTDVEVALDSGVGMACMVVEAGAFVGEAGVQPVTKARSTIDTSTSNALILFITLLLGSEAYRNGDEISDGDYVI